MFTSEIVLILSNLFYCTALRAVKDDLSISDSSLLTNYEINCILPPFPKNGKYMVVGKDTETPTPGLLVENSTYIYYSCYNGFEPFVASTAICYQGHWTTDFQQCRKIKTCVLPNVPANGIYRLPDFGRVAHPGTKIPDWTVLTFSCDVLYELIGERIILCRNGIWNDEPPLCIRSNICTIPERLTNGKYEIIDSEEVALPGKVVNERTALYYSCEAGYTLVGGSISLCHKGFWLGDMPICEESKSCKLPQFPKNGHFEIVGLTEPLKEDQKIKQYSILSMTCEDSYVLLGKNLLFCRNSSWSGDVPKCQKIEDCIVPEIPQNGEISLIGSMVTPLPGSSVKEKEILQFSCHYSYQIIGKELSACYRGNWTSKIPRCAEHPEDCSSIKSQISGVYFIQPENSLPFLTLCNFELYQHKWTVIQTRFNGSVDFNRNYEDYMNGFGSVTGEYWLGLENIHQITKNNNHELYISLEAFNGTRKFARYRDFRIGDKQSGYELSVNGYNGTAGNALWFHSGKKFSTFDNDQDLWTSGNCAVRHNGGWWYGYCARTNLNGIYHPSAVVDRTSMSWWYMFQNWMALKSSNMLIRRKD